MIQFTLTPETVRETCIRNNWYTSGTNADYENILSYVHMHCNHMADFEAQAKIEYVADDIYKHSNIRLMADVSGCTPIEVRANMEYILLNAFSLSITD